MCARTLRLSSLNSSIRFLDLYLLFLVVYGLASGVFLGCLAVALAEVLNVFPVLFRRANLKNGLGFLITAFAAGKTVGGLVYFFWIA